MCLSGYGQDLFCNRAASYRRVTKPWRQPQRGAEPPSALSPPFLLPARTSGVPERRPAASPPPCPFPSTPRSPLGLGEVGGEGEGGERRAGLAKASAPSASRPRADEKSPPASRVNSNGAFMNRAQSLYRVCLKKKYCNCA